MLDFHAQAMQRAAEISMRFLGEKLDLADMEETRQKGIAIFVVGLMMYSFKKHASDKVQLRNHVLENYKIMDDAQTPRDKLPKIVQRKADAATKFKYAANK